MARQSSALGERRVATANVGARPTRAPTMSAVFLIAAWFGLLAGVLEGAIRTTLRGVSGFVYLNSPAILWIAPAFNAVLFLTIAAGVGLILRWWKGAVSAALLGALFSWIALSGLLLTLGKMNQGAALILGLGVAWQLGRWFKRHEPQLLLFLRRTIVPLFVLAAALGAAGGRWDRWQERSLLQALPAAPAGKPNLLLITLDTLRADHLSSYGYERRTTPNIDRLATRGVQFEHAIANSSWTLPSHASLFTGRLPYEHHADWLDPLDASYPTLAEVLAAEGYATAAFAANTEYVTPERGLARGFARFEVYGSSLSDDIVRTLYGKKMALNMLPRLGYFDIPGRKRASQVNREFLRWLDDNPRRPFFAFLNYLEVHDPHVPVQGYDSEFSEQAARGDLINFQFQPHVFRRKPRLTTEEIRSEINGYDACLAYLDAQLGLLFQDLAARGLEKDTLIILTSDHGEAFGNHDLFGHGNSLYIETLHVPLIVVWPGRIPAGRRIGPTVGLQRVPATVLDLLQIRDASPPFPGESLAALWSSGGVDVPGDAVLSQVSSGRFKEGPPSYPTTSGSLTSVVTDHWHLIRSESGRVQLFAWRDDPLEARDVAATTAGQAAIGDLERLLPPHPNREAQR
jgi:arylsulfatase A-like enzyme